MAKHAPSWTNDCRDYINRYCDTKSQRAYVTYFESDEVTPWGLVSVVVGLDPQKGQDWGAFIIGDMRQKLGRFAEIFIDPSIVQ